MKLEIRAANGESVCYRVLGIPLLEKLPVSWFLVDWFQSFLVSKFLGFKISKLQRFNDPILPNCHSMFFDRY